MTLLIAGRALLYVARHIRNDKLWEVYILEHYKHSSGERAAEDEQKNNKFSSSTRKHQSTEGEKACKNFFLQKLRYDTMHGMMMIEK